jgi:spermidine synthase
VNPSLAASAWVQLQLDVVRTALAVLPGALLWGASFPLALAALADSPDDPARDVGRVYAANTFGAILGSLVAGLVLIVFFGTHRAEQAVILVSALAGAALLVETKRPAWMPTAAMAIALVMASTVAPVPGLFVAFGRFTATQVGQASVIYVGEGWNASVAVSKRTNGVRNYHNAGKVQASSEPQDMRLQRMLGHLTTLIPSSPRRVLVIGCGAGVTAGAVSIDPAVERETIAEIEPLVPRAVSAFFSAHNFDVVRSPKVEVRIDDARHFLFTTRETFDAITSDPLDPWVKGAAMLYTREFFELVKSRLRPGGIVTLFVQLYESNTAAVKSEIATFFEGFLRGMVFANTYNGSGYDLVLVGQADGTRVDLDELDARLQRPEYAAVARSLSEIGMESVVDLFATYAGSADDLTPWLRDAEINRDRNLRLQFLAGRGLNLYQAAAIFAEMVPHAQVPTGVFTGSEDLLASLAAKMTAGWGR